MKLRNFTFNGEEYSYDVDKLDYYHFDRKEQAHCIHYTAYDYEGNAHKVEWRIPGNTCMKLADAKKHAMNMSEVFPPWDMINLSNVYDKKDVVCQLKSF